MNESRMEIFVETIDSTFKTLTGIIEKHIYTEEQAGKLKQQFLQVLKFGC